MEKNRTHTVAVIIGYFIGFEKYGIDTFYNRKFQKWLVYNSTDAESLNSENDNFNPIFDEAGFITNVTFTPFENGVPLTESFFIDEEINQLNKLFDLPYLQKSHERKIKHFLNYLKNKQEVQAAQIAEIKKEEVPTVLQSTDKKNMHPKHDPNLHTENKKEMHNNIFVGNSFEVWESLFENLNIDETKNTDLRFMYEVMKDKNQIHENITVKAITNWINKEYEFSITKLQYTSIKSKSNDNRMTIYNLIK